MRVADLIARRLADHGLQACFLVTGGGAMHLNDAFGAEVRLRKVCCHHEQACAMAAEGYARIAGVPAIVNVTTGPGGINALNGVFGAFTDSIPMLVVSGQVKRETLLATRPQPGLRQLGDQEVDILAMAAPITKARFLLDDPADTVRVIDEAVSIATRGRPGPVWIDVPVDVQGANVAEDPMPVPARETPEPWRDPGLLDAVLDAVAASDRPLLFAGSGVRIAGVDAVLVQLAETLGVPVVTAWTHDLIASDHPLFAGRPGTIGTRAGNFAVQSADLVLVLGSRLNIRQVSYNYGSFARDARKIWVDIDPAELAKPFVTSDLSIVADLSVFLPALLDAARARQNPQPSTEPQRAAPHEPWARFCRELRTRYEPRDDDYPVRSGVVNAYHFVSALFEALSDDDIVACGDATACIVPFQRGRIRGRRRLFSNSGSASMGYDLPASIGAAVAAPGRRVICLAGDGSVMMNLQELALLSGLGLDIKVFVLDNDGYLSIKQTQRNFFGREVGSSTASGLFFPDFAAVGSAFGLPSRRLDPAHLREQIAGFLACEGPGLCVVPLDPAQEFEPRLRSRMIDGVIRTPELDDMYPFLDPDEVDGVRASARAVRRSQP
jgi:acetolactate synthase-1/2/3 large subunit